MAEREHSVAPWLGVCACVCLRVHEKDISRSPIFIFAILSPVSLSAILHFKYRMTLCPSANLIPVVVDPDRVAPAGPAQTVAHDCDIRSRCRGIAMAVEAVVALRAGRAAWPL